jgi:predicted metalloprotease with PDZ domain
VGLRLATIKTTVAGPGFTAARSLGVSPMVTSVVPGSEAERAGLAVGDSIVQLNGQAVNGDFNYHLAQLRAGDTIHLRVRNHRGDRELHWKLESREQAEFRLVDVDNISPEQKARRAAWLRGESEAQAHP